VANNDSVTSIPEGAVKICGLREPVHARVAAEAGADLLGFVFAPSKRQITAEVARDCILFARESTDKRLLTVGVFVNATVEEMNKSAEIAGLDLIQIHGNAESIDRTKLARPCLTTLNPSPEMLPDDVSAMIRLLAQSPGVPLAYLIDGYRAGEHGGIGVLADWNLARVLARAWPIVLAGGLTPDNVGEAIAAVSPRAVDVSSGIESEGTKDAAKIESFIRAAKAAFNKAPRG
jgi:phosphoribosylanthranilate isomerase